MPPQVSATRSRRALAVRRGLHPYGAAVARVAHGVAHQVLQRAREPAPSAYAVTASSHSPVTRDAAGPGERLDVGDGVGDEVAQRDHLERRARSARRAAARGRAGRRPWRESRSTLVDGSGGGSRRDRARRRPRAPRPSRGSRPAASAGRARPTPTISRRRASDHRLGANGPPPRLAARSASADGAPREQHADPEGDGQRPRREPSRPTASAEPSSAIERAPATTPAATATTTETGVSRAASEGERRPTATTTSSASTPVTVAATAAWMATLQSTVITGRAPADRRRRRPPRRRGSPAGDPTGSRRPTR